jgi:hypothetical protein
MSDHRLIVGLLRANDGDLGARRNQRRSQRVNVLRQPGMAIIHAPMESQTP